MSTQPVSPSLRGSPLARYLLAGYVLLIAYATLHPLSDWYNAGIRPFAFLGAFWPRYYTGFDIGANFLAYVPLGVLAVGALYPGLRGGLAWLLATGLGIALSLSLEALQNYLPSRIPSTLDVACNSAGAAFGALTSLYLSPRIIGRGSLYQWRHRLFEAGKITDIGLVLIAGWLLALLRPESLLFGNGDLRFLFETPPTVLYDPSLFVRVEALVAAANLVAVALLWSLLLNDDAPRRVLFLLLLAAAFVVRTLAFLVLFEGHHALAWLTPGAMIGLLFGVPCALLALSLRRGAAVAVCGLLLMAATALVNLAPDNPYLILAHQLWYQGHFLNFNGLTRLVSTLWPFAALTFVLLYGARGRSITRQAAPPGSGRL